MIGSFSIIADQSISRAGATSSIRVRRSSPNFVLERLQVALQPRALPRRALDQLLELLALLGQRLALAADLHLLELAQATAAAC